MEFIKSIFTTPSRLWTITQELTFIAFVIICIAIIALAVWAVIAVMDKIKKNKYYHCKSERNGYPCITHKHCLGCKSYKKKEKLSKKDK